jgi:hypothetical protein
LNPRAAARIRAGYGKNLFDGMCVYGGHRGINGPADPAWQAETRIEARLVSLRRGNGRIRHL